MKTVQRMLMYRVFVVLYQLEYQDYLKLRVLERFLPVFLLSGLPPLRMSLKNENAMLAMLQCDAPYKNLFLKVSQSESANSIDGHASP